MSLLPVFLASHSVPTFVDTFSGGTLNTSNWSASVGSAPGDGTFAANKVDCSLGYLRLTLLQQAATPNSIGGEIQRTATTGYGLYEYTFRAGSTATNIGNPGHSTSGSVSAGFIYQSPNSITEIDFEVEGQFPSRLELSCFQNASNVQNATRFFEDLAQSVHLYSLLWLPTPYGPGNTAIVEYYIDECLHMVSFGPQVNTPIPSVPAYQLLNFWGTDSINFGGLSTIGTTYMYCTRAAFTAL